MATKPKPRYEVQIHICDDIWGPSKGEHRFHREQDAIDKAYAIGRARVIDIHLGKVVWPK